MNRKEKNQISYLPGAEIDAAVFKKFGIKCETTWSLYNGHHTVIDESVTDEYILKRIHDFIEGWTTGLLEVRERLNDKSKWI